jgi:hypothetical protein
LFNYNLGIWPGSGNLYRERSSKLICSCFNGNQKYPADTPVKGVCEKIKEADPVRYKNNLPGTTLKQARN